MSDTWEREIDEAVATIRLRSTRPVQGCLESELSAFQVQRGVRLPAAYLRFLRAVGKDGGSFLVGSDLWFDALVGLRPSAEALLEDDHGPPLDPDAFVFCSHQGYQFLFFALGPDPDPEVRYYLEGERAFRAVAPSFSSWLMQAVVDEFPETR